MITIFHCLKYFIFIWINLSTQFSILRNFNFIYVKIKIGIHILITEYYVKTGIHITIITINIML